MKNMNDLSTFSDMSLFRHENKHVYCFIHVVIYCPYCFTTASPLTPVITSYPECIVSICVSVILTLIDYLIYFYIIQIVHIRVNHEDGGCVIAINISTS